MSSNRETDLPRATSVRDKIEAVESKIQNVKQASSQSFVRVFPHKSPTETSTTSSVSSRLTVVDNDLFPKETTPSTYTVPSKTVHKPDEIHHQDCFDEAKESNKRGTFNQKLNQVTEYATTKVPEKKTLYRWPPSRTSPRIGIEKTSYYDYPSVPGRMKSNHDFFYTRNFKGSSHTNMFEFRDSGACGMDYSDNDEEFTNESYWEKNSKE
ncbi:uncharacterized protein LOC134259919 [Saccostrea cucullata]|uniref:uncharacterized protein LOC134259919 n=1 Tax=Saccostrea cuccullata TaxID=36930 RepID=UPI002ED106AE